MKFSAFTRRISRIPLWVDGVFVVCVAASLCIAWVQFAGYSSVDFDEAFSAYIARFNPLEIAYYTALDVHPPLYYTVLHYWGMLFGHDVPTLRLLSTAWSVVALIFGFLLVRRMFGRKAAWFAMPLLAAEPLFFHYAGIMRMYSMAAAITIVATYILARLATTTDHNQRKRLWGIYAVLVAAGMWTNYFTALVWVAHALWLFFGQRPRQDFWTFLRHSGWTKATGLAVLLFLPWLPAFLFRFAEVQVSGFWIKPISVDTLPSTLSMSVIYQTATDAKGWLMPIITGGAVAFAFAAWQLAKHYSRQQRSLFWLLAATGLVPIGLLIVMSLPPLASSYVYRYVLSGISICTLLLGVVIAALRFRRYTLLKKAVLYVGTLTLFISGCSYSIYIGNQNLDSGKVTLVSQMVDKLANVTGNAPVLTWSPYTYYVAAAYEQAGHPIYYAYTDQLTKIGSLKMLADHPGDRGIHDVAAFAQQYDSVWILAEDKKEAQQPPAIGWHQGRSITLTDPVTGKQPAIAVEYLR